MVDFKCSVISNAVIIEGLDRQNGVSSKKPISVGHVPQVSRTVISFEFEESKTIGETSDIT